MQRLKQPSLPKAIVVAAAILGGCIVLGAVIVASNFSDSLSPFSRWSMSNQLESELKNANSGQVVVANTKCRLLSVQLINAKLFQGGTVLQLFYNSSVYPLENVPAGTNAMIGNVAGVSILTKKSDGTYSGIVYIGDTPVKVALS